MTLRQTQGHSERSRTMREIFKQYNIKPSKKLGQNFLIDKSILKKIINAANLSSDDIVLEIGPGLGVLTIELAKRVKKVIAIEKDRRMCEILKKVLKNYKNVEIINKDILDVGHSTSHIETYKLIANLPYYITSPVIRKFLETKNKPKLMILMVQKEVGQRICAKSKMSLLSVAVQFYAKPEIISYVSKKSFWPVPKVDSAIIKIVPRKSAFRSTLIRDKFFELVKKGFSSKRKMLKNNLSSTSLGARKIEKIFGEIGLNPKVRAENLSIQDWLKLFHKICFP